MVTANTFSEKQSSEAKTDAITFDPSSTAVLVVDMLKDFFSDGGAMVLDGGDVLYEPHRELLGAARDKGIPVFWLNQDLPPDDSLFQTRAVHCLSGTWGAEIVDQIPVDASDIIGVSDRDSRLVMYMRNRQIITAELEKSCSPRDFYLGFYVEQNDDGKLCVDRDRLLSRAGAKCRISNLNRLVAVTDDR